FEIVILVPDKTQLLVVAKGRLGAIGRTECLARPFLRHRLVAAFVCDEGSDHGMSVGEHWEWLALAKLCEREQRFVVEFVPAQGQDEFAVVAIGAGLDVGETSFCGEGILARLERLFGPAELRQASDSLVERLVHLAAVRIHAQKKVQQVQRNRKKLSSAS